MPKGGGVRVHMGRVLRCRVCRTFTPPSVSYPGGGEPSIVRGYHSHNGHNGYHHHLYPFGPIGTYTRVGRGM